MSARIIENEYIVVLRDDADVDLGARAARERGGRVVAEWMHALKGYAVQGPPDLIVALRTDPNVQYVEQVQEYSVDGTQSNATWGLDRIDQDNLPLNSTYTYSNTGAGVRAYIIDTGIRTAHSEFGGRATFGVNYAGGKNDDCHGHGTHVAGTVGGTTYGVAKAVRLIAVKVLNCAGSGSTTGVVNGINWVTQKALKPAVANMSLGGGVSSTIDIAVTNAVNSGIAFAVAAGNSGADACNYSPARAGAAITVGATTSTDQRASYSNFGTCVDIFAPGSSITSAWKNSNTATNTISGTSMASPHVAGVAALYLEANPGSSPSTLRNALVNAGTSNVGNAGAGSPNKLLRSNW
jgi:subtilisin family serine protease